MNELFFKRWRWWLAVILLILIVTLYLRPIPKVAPQIRQPQVPPAQAVQLPWPTGGQAAIGAEGYGLLTQHGTSSPVPIGSTAKVITTLAVLKQKPISPGSQGPTITLNSNDVDLFNSYYSNNGSVTQVNAGEQITELQALQSMLIPSSNNMADSLAIWAFGSTENYLAYANKMVKSLGLTQTHIGDANGFSDTTTSTADDMVKLGLVSIKNPVFASVVSQSTAEVPIAGTIKNTNFLLGQDGIVGIKTGHTDKAGGNYLFAANQNIQGHKITLVGAILSQSQLADAILPAPSLIKASDSGFQTITIHKNQILGSYKAPWGASAPFKADKDISLLVWKDSEIKISVQPEKIGPSKVGTVVGKFTVNDLDQTASAGLILSSNLPAPSPTWHIFR